MKTLLSLSSDLTGAGLHDVIIEVGMWRSLLEEVRKPYLDARADACLRLDLFMRISDEGD